MPKENQRSKPRDFKNSQRPIRGRDTGRPSFSGSRSGSFGGSRRSENGRSGNSGFRNGGRSGFSGSSGTGRMGSDRRTQANSMSRFGGNRDDRPRAGFAPRFDRGKERSGAPAGKSTSWGRVADWYRGMVEDDKSYQQQVILPNLLKVLDLKHGEQILDLACGEGSFSREFARLGAHVIGVDISPELIELAKERDNFNIRYETSPADDLPMIPSGSVQIVTIVSAIQNMPDLDAVLGECGRVLRKGGRLVIVMNHPAFRIPKSSSWGWDSRGEVLYRRLDRYLTENKALIQMHPGDDPREVTSSFHRPLSAYFESLRRSGFTVRLLEEWISNRKSEPGPRSVAEDKARKEFPLFLCLEAVKTDDGR